MNSTTPRKITQGLAIVGLLLAGGFAAATPASATPANCLMTANPAASLTQDFSSYAEGVRNANVDKCQQAKEGTERTAALSKGSRGAGDDEQNERAVGKVAL